MSPETIAPHGVEAGRVRQLWMVSVGVSFLFAAVIVAILYRSHSAPEPLPDDQVMASTPADLATLKPAYEQRSAAAGWEKPIYIPTGLFIQSIEFTGPYNVRMTGYVWQRYGKDVPATLRRGVVLPEADKQDLVQAYKTQQGDDEVIGWYFVVTVRQPFFYARYPFDQQDVWLRMWGMDFSRNVVLVPDYQSYTSMDPASTPGLEQTFVLEGWKIDRSFFGYRLGNYNTNFGFANYNGQKDFPELFFNIDLRRRVLTPLVTQAVAPMVVLVLTFITFLFFSTDKDQRGAFGLSWSGVIGVWSGGFFATLVAQGALRTQVRSDSFVYLESLHVVLYPTILVVAGLVTLSVAHPDRKILGYRDNLVPKMLYLPTVLGILLAVTILLFRN